MARRQQVTFTDPVTNQTYVWPINPGFAGVTQPAGKTRQIQRTSNTGNVGATRQQGDDGPYIVHWEPEIFTEAHETALWQWYVKSSKRTIYLTDWNGEQVEGQIVTLQRQQIGALAGMGDINLRGFYCKYVFEFEVYRFIGGPLATAGVTP